MKLTLLLPLLAVSFEIAHAKDVVRGNGRRSRALQDELSLPSDLSVAGIEVADLETIESAERCPGVIGSNKSGKSGKNGVQYCLKKKCGRCTGLATLFKEKGCFDLLTNDPFEECYTLPALEKLALDQVPKCALLLDYAIEGGCMDGRQCPCFREAISDNMDSMDAVAESESESASDDLFGIKMEDLNEFALANLPSGLKF